ncbi:hypothetical protein F4604DRAFT_754949 [Suillus subluteus]|nr:hypothetical protein F4604DRAFT_754949 [Suillus subluteus]
MRMLLLKRCVLAISILHSTGGRILTKCAPTVSTYEYFRYALPPVIFKYMWFSMLKHSGATLRSSRPSIPFRHGVLTITSGVSRVMYSARLAAGPRELSHCVGQHLGRGTIMVAYVAYPLQKDHLTSDYIRQSYFDEHILLYLEFPRQVFED